MECPWCSTGAMCHSVQIQAGLIPQFQTYKNNFVVKHLFKLVRLFVTTVLGADGVKCCPREAQCRRAHSRLQF